jgi:hypothetical protein
MTPPVPSAQTAATYYHATRYTRGDIEVGMAVLTSAGDWSFLRTQDGEVIRGDMGHVSLRDGVPIAESVWQAALKSTREGDPMSPTYALGQAVRYTAPEPGGAQDPSPWYIAGIHASALDTGETWIHYTLASAPAQAPDERHCWRTKIPFVTDEQLAPYGAA